MLRQRTKENTIDLQLPKLGSKPYFELMDKTAPEHLDRQSTYIGFCLLWLSDNILDAVDVELSPFHIAESKVDLLLLLLLHEDRKIVTPSAIADRLGIRRASATAMLDWLEQRNWIVREQSNNDRRMTQVSITPEGRSLVSTVLPTFWSTCESMIKKLDIEERNTLQEILVKLNEGIEKRLGKGR